VEDRLAVLDRLKRKYGPTLSDVLAKKDTLAGQLESLQNADLRRASLEAETLAARDRYLTRARALSQKRRDASKLFSQKLQRLLGELAMGHSQFEVRFEAELGESAWTEAGVDAAECYLSANPGETRFGPYRAGGVSRGCWRFNLSAADTAGQRPSTDRRRYQRASRWTSSGRGCGS
jgi:DNA repair protein RecN (Recombination protein N)